MLLYEKLIYPQYRLRNKVSDDKTGERHLGEI